MNQSIEENFNCSTLFNNHDFNNVAIINMTTACLSFLACSFVIVIIVILKVWEFFSQRLVIYLTITALLTAISAIIHRIDFYNQTSDFYKGFCIFTGFLTQVTSWMLLNSIIAITIFLFCRVMLKRNTDKYEMVYVFCIFLFPLVFNWIPFIHMSYGKAGVWCWIRSFNLETCQVHLFGLWLQFGLWYIPLYLTMTTLTIFYIIILVKIRKERKILTGINNISSKNELKKMNSELLSLLAYPLIYFILNIPLLANRIYSAIRPTQPSLVLWYLSASCIPLQGIFTALAFTFGTETRKRLTWANIRASTQRKKVKAYEYSLKVQNMSDSRVFSTFESIPDNNNKQSEYTAYHESHL